MAVTFEIFTNILCTTANAISKKGGSACSLPKRFAKISQIFLLNERVKINLSDDESTEMLTKILKNNNFFVTGNVAVEKAFAYGTCAFLLSVKVTASSKLPCFFLEFFMPEIQVPPWLADTMKDGAYSPTKADIMRVEPQSITEMLLKYLCLNGTAPVTYAKFLTSDLENFVTSDGLQLDVIE
jgi:hypothetical protein